MIVPASVDAIQENTFWYCSNLTSAEMNGAASLGFGAFAACNKLTDLKISGKLTKIDDYAFTDNTATATITFYGSRDTWERVEKPSNDPFLQRANMVFDENHIEQPEDVAGDINGDGSCSVADVVMLQKYLLTSGDLTPEQGKIADMNQDGKLDSSDLSRLKETVLSH